MARLTGTNNPLLGAGVTRAIMGGRGPSSAWGIHNIGKSAGLAPGAGLHWMPTRHGSLIPGPGIKGTLFVERAFEIAKDRYIVQTSTALQELAKDLQKYCNTDYERKHRGKIAWAEEQRWENLGFRFDEYKEQKWYDRNKGRFPKIEGLTRPEVESAQRMLAHQGITGGAQLPWLKKLGIQPTTGKDVLKIGSYDWYRESRVTGGLFKGTQIDFKKVERTTGKTFFAEAGVKGFSMPGYPPTVTTRTADIFPGYAAQLRGGSALTRMYGDIYFMAYESISEGVEISSVRYYETLVASTHEFKEVFESAVIGTFAEAQASYASGRGTRGQPAWRTRSAIPFDPAVHIKCNVNAPPVGRLPRAGDARTFSVWISFFHPAATALNYGLSSPMEFGVARGTQTPLDDVEGVRRAWWRYGPRNG